MQRVWRAEVRVAGEMAGSIGPGLCAFVGVGREDDEADAAALAERVANLRVFEDETGKMNLSLLDTSRSLLAISQFTLFADTRRGRRPSFVAAAPPEFATALMERFVAEARRLGLQVETGRFGAHMRVELGNDGPVTLMLDTADKRRG